MTYVEKMKRSALRKSLGFDEGSFTKYFRLVNGDVEELKKIAKMSNGERRVYTIKKMGKASNGKRNPRSELGRLHRMYGQGVYKWAFKRYLDYCNWDEQKIQEFMKLPKIERTRRLKGISKELGYKTKVEVVKEQRDA